MYSSVVSVKKKIDEKYLLQLLNDENRPTEEVDWEDEADVCVVRFNQAAVDAADEIDPYLRGNYKLPFTEAPKEIIAISDDITIYNIYKRRNRENMPDSITDIYKSCIKKLEKYQNGTLLLDVEKVVDEVGSDSVIKTNKTSSDRIFSNELWKRY